MSFPDFTDCHCHILPGIDDGARDLAMALEMVRVALASGTRAIITTPHHLSGSFRNTREDILAAVAEFREILAREEIALEVHPGSELHLTDDLADRIKDREAMTYNDAGQHALVELPAQFVPNGTEQILEKILYSGCTPVIAHPERNSELCAHPERAMEWVSWGCCLQLTAQSIAGDFGNRIQSVSREFIRRGQVHLVGSDAHRPQGRSPNLRNGYATLTGWVGEQGADLLTQINPRKLLSGEKLSPLSAAVDSQRPRQGLWSKLFSR